MQNPTEKLSQPDNRDARLEELTGENLAVYARTYAALARAALARATGNQ